MLFFYCNKIKLSGFCIKILYIIYAQLVSYAISFTEFCFQIFTAMLSTISWFGQINYYIFFWIIYDSSKAIQQIAVSNFSKFCTELVLWIWKFFISGYRRLPGLVLKPIWITQNFARVILSYSLHFCSCPYGI